jgi:Mg2+ and Co2+ transporter CorA
MNTCSNIEEYGNRLEDIGPLLTSLVQVVDARRSFTETANITRLTTLALAFVPLTYVTGLFSMNVNVAPGAPYFWVYFAVAIPVTLLVFLVARAPNPRQLEQILERVKFKRNISVLD